MRVLVIGDGHLRHGDRRNPMRLRALDQILLHASQLDDLVAIVWPGDLLHGESGIVDRNTLGWYLSALAALAPVLVIRGNHDKPGDLDIYGQLGTKCGISVVTTPRVITAVSPAGVLAVGCLPYPEKSSLVAANLPASEIAGAVHRAFAAVFSDLGRQLDECAVPTLFAGHVTIGGAELSVGQPLVGQDLQIDATHLAQLPASTVRVFNHIHKPQEIHGAYYVGSIAPVDYGEVERKRFLELVHDGQRWHVESVPLDIPPMYHVDGVATRDAFTWAVRKGPDGPETVAPESWAGADVRVRFRFSAADAGAIDLIKARIIAEFAEAAHLELEPVATTTREVRAPEVVAAPTLDAKLRAWATAAGLDTPESLMAKLARLEATDSEALLAEVSASLGRRESAVAA
jgi:exonuclease SbcD